MQGRAAFPSRRFEILLIKPSHYDDSGYVIRWFRSTMPSNSLAAVSALACGAARRRILGPDVEIAVKAIDETNTRASTKSIISRFKKNRCFGFVGLVGVQSNEFPRAMDTARPLLQAGVNVVIGGFHVSGSLAMRRPAPYVPCTIAWASSRLTPLNSLFSRRCRVPRTTRR